MTVRTVKSEPCTPVGNFMQWWNWKLFTSGRESCWDFCTGLGIQWDAVPICGAGGGGGVPELHFQVFLSPLFVYLYHYPPPLKFCHWVEMVIMPGKYFNAIIKVTGSVATQERKCSGKTGETFKIFFHSLKKNNPWRLEGQEMLPLYCLFSQMPLQAYPFNLYY